MDRVRPPPTLVFNVKDSIAHTVSHILKDALLVCISIQFVSIEILFICFYSFKIILCRQGHYQAAR